MYRIDQYIPLFSSDKFNICCDETFDLVHGKHKDMDTGKLYIDFVSKIIDYVKSKGKTVMMWGDILHQYPEKIDKLPKDTILLNWEYDAEPPKEKIAKFKNIGLSQIVCPGTNTWHIIGAEAIMLMSEILCMQNGIKIKRQIDIEKWLNKYRRAWLSKNKESELREIENVVIKMNEDF